MEVDTVVDSVMFPDLSMFELDPESEEARRTEPLLDWALGKIGTFQYRLEELMRNRELRRKKITLIGHIPTTVILQLANDVFGFNGWSLRIVDCAVVSEELNEEMDEYSMKQEATVEITLLDGTTSCAKGVGNCQKLPHKYMCMGNSKKMAITDGMRNAILNLTSISIVKEEAIKQET